MTDYEITSLLQARDNICIVASLLDIPADTRSIDAVLSTVPAGRDNRVDLALGRPCAKLPEREDYGLHAWTTAEVIADELTSADIIDMEQRTAETSRAEDYDEREGSVI